jgi:hypothetical protein
MITPCAYMASLGRLAAQIDRRTDAGRAANMKILAYFSNREDISTKYLDLSKRRARERRDRALAEFARCHADKMMQCDCGRTFMGKTYRVHKLSKIHNDWMRDYLQ